MGRMTEALQRARGVKNPPSQTHASPADAVALRSINDFDLLEGGGRPAESTVRPSPGQPVRVSPTPSPAEMPAPVRTEHAHDNYIAQSTPIACRRCERQRSLPAVPHSFWESRVLALLRLRPYQCRVCQHRFYRFATAAAAHSMTAARLPMTVFLPPTDGRPFDEVIRNMAQAERAQAPGGAGSRHPSTRTPQPTGERQVTR
jgi:hypothetical protein